MAAKTPYVDWKIEKKKNRKKK
jgi:hypothetical protein